MSDKQFIDVRWRYQINFWVYTYFLKMDQYIFFKRMTLVINNREWLLKEYKLKKNNQEIIGNGEIKVYMGRDILRFVEQIQGNIGSRFKID